MSLVHPDKCDVCGRTPSHDCSFSYRQGLAEGKAETRQKIKDLEYKIAQLEEARRYDHEHFLGMGTR